MDLVRLVQDKRPDILRIAAQHGATNIRVFGSVARGQTGPESDLDLLVDMGPKRTPFFPGGLIADLADLLGCRVEVVSRDALHECIRDRVLAEAVSL